MAIFVGSQTMLELPFIQEIVAETQHKTLLRFLAARFVQVPEEIRTAVQAVQDPVKLDELVDWAGRCPDLAAFQPRLPAHDHGS
jgi:hypothetical protein